MLPMSISISLNGNNLNGTKALGGTISQKSIFPKSLSGNHATKPPTAKLNPIYHKHLLSPKRNHSSKKAFPLKPLKRKSFP